MNFEIIPNYFNYKSVEICQITWIIVIVKKQFRNSPDKLDTAFGVAMEAEKMLPKLTELHTVSIEREDQFSTDQPISDKGSHVALLKTRF